MERPVFGPFFVGGLLRKINLTIRSVYRNLFLCKFANYKIAVRQRILIIDDEKDLCNLIMRILSDADFDTRCAHSLKEGKQKWEELNPVIVILDQNLPDGNGLDLLEAYDYLLKKSSVVFITADAQQEARIRAERLGVAAFMYKPFSMADIRNIAEAQRNRA